MRKRLTTLLVPCLLLAAALALSACGGGSDSSGDEEQIEETIEKSATRHDPGKCTELLTQNFIEQNSDATGKAALKECEVEVSDRSDDPKSVTVSTIEVDGTDATAEVAFAGGGFDGQTVNVALVKNGDQWRLDEVIGFAELDTATLARTLEEQFEAANGEIPPAQIKCIGDGIRAASEAEVAELVLSGSSTPLVEFAEACE